MSLQLAPLQAAQHAAACALLTDAFEDDRGLRALLGARDDRDLQRPLRHWFAATLRLNARQPAWAVWDGAQLAAIALFTHQPPAPLGLAQWTLTVAAQCGPGTVGRTLQHERHRAAYRPTGPHAVLEFVAVAPAYRGRRLTGRLLEVATPGLGDGPLWLETTRPQNVALFTGYGFRIVGQAAFAGGLSTFMLRGSRDLKGHL